MTVKVGINGFGRIGRNYFRALIAQGALHVEGNREGRVMSTKYTIRLPWPGPRRQRAGTDFEPTPVTTLTRTSDRSYTHAVIWQYAALDD